MYYGVRDKCCLTVAAFASTAWICDCWPALSASGPKNSRAAASVHLMLFLTPSMLTSLFASSYASYIFLFHAAFLSLQPLLPKLAQLGWQVEEGGRSAICCYVLEAKEVCWVMIPNRKVSLPGGIGICQL